MTWEGEMAYIFYEQIVKNVSIRSTSLLTEEGKPQKGFCIGATGPTHPPPSMQKVDLLEGVETRGWIDQQGGYVSSPDEK